MVLNKIYENFFQAIDIFKRDKIILMLSLIPIGIGSPSLLLTWALDYGGFLR